MPLEPDIQAAASAIGAFAIDGRMMTCERFGSGHIHDTFSSQFNDGGSESRYLHQRINRTVFQDPGSLMQTVARVSRHQQQCQFRRHPGDWQRRALQLVRTRDGLDYVVDAAGDWWRSFVFIENSEAVTRLEPGDRRARSLGAGFGEFLEDLSQLNLGDFPETIPDFHDLGLRLEQLREAARSDSHGRLGNCTAEFDALQRLQWIDARLSSARGSSPQRLAHNDAKLENLLYDRTTGAALCVTDLDTVMPGLALFDFGDIIRSSAVSRREDEPGQPGAQDVSWENVRQIVEGFLSACHSLKDAERDCLALGPLVMTYETAVRFLTDYLNGDIYFRTVDPEQNLRRSRAQIQVLAVLIEAEEEIAALIAGS